MTSDQVQTGQRLGNISRPARARQRLSPDERIPQILRAAAQEFSRRGFQQTRVEDIAAAAGLSKGGFYAHFSGKEAVFDALLRRYLSGATLDLQAQFKVLPPMPQIIDRLSESLTAGLAQEDAMIVFRILLADGWRVPDVVQSWLLQYFENVQNQLCTLLQRCVSEGLCRQSLVVQKPWLLLSPVVHAMVARLVDPANREFAHEQIRQDLANLLSEILLFDQDLLHWQSRAETCQ